VQAVHTKELTDASGPLPDASFAPALHGEELNRHYAPFLHGDVATGRLIALAERVARTDVTVLITGPSGAGKEVLARHLHLHSLRQAAPFIGFNCACLPESMVEDMLFGHERGAFTGAVSRFDGLFAQASKGTLFLDEVGDLPHPVQAKLLRVLQEREFTPLGATRPQKADFRLLAATNRDLKRAVAEGHFREDLYYRLHIFPLQLAPLSDRRGDIVPLARALLQKHLPPGRQLRLGAAAEVALLNYAWPGNVRELENVLQRAAVLCEESEILVEHLVLDQEIPPGGTAARQDRLAAEVPRKRVISAREAQQILDAVRETSNRIAAANRLGISERTLRYRLSRLRDAGVDIDLHVRPGEVVPS
jgi:two-component system response regulator FlrC